MGTTVHTGVVCTSCGAAIDTSKDQPCACGSTAHTHQLNVSETIKINVYESRKIKERVLGVVKRITLAGDSFWRNGKIWVKRIYVVDKEKKWYTETVSDSDGNIIHQNSEPLEKHHNKKE